MSASSFQEDSSGKVETKEEIFEILDSFLGIQSFLGNSVNEQAQKNYFFSLFGKADKNPAILAALTDFFVNYPVSPELQRQIEYLVNLENQPSFTNQYSDKSESALKNELKYCPRLRVQKLFSEALVDQRYGAAPILLLIRVVGGSAFILSLLSRHPQFEKFRIDYNPYLLKFLTQRSLLTLVACSLSDSKEGYEALSRCLDLPHTSELEYGLYDAPTISHVSICYWRVISTGRIYLTFYNLPPELLVPMMIEDRETSKSRALSALTVYPEWTHDGQKEPSILEVIFTSPIECEVLEHPAKEFTGRPTEQALPEFLMQLCLASVLKTDQGLLKQFVAQLAAHAPPYIIEKLAPFLVSREGAHLLLAFVEQEGVINFKQPKENIKPLLDRLINMPLNEMLTLIPKAMEGFYRLYCEARKEVVGPKASKWFAITDKLELSALKSTLVFFNAPKSAGIEKGINSDSALG